MNGKEIVKRQVKANTENRLKNDTGRTLTCGWKASRYWKRSAL